MTTSLQYIEKLEESARQLRVTNDRIITRWFDLGMPAEPRSATFEALEVNRVAAEHYDSMAAHLRHHNGEFVMVRPQIAPWGY